MSARNARADRWGRPALLGHSNLWYIAARENATWYAGVQGYKGARWGKETGPQFNREIDSNLRTTCGGGLNLICPSPRLHCLHCFTLLRPYLAHFFPFFPVFCAFSPSRRGGSNEPQAGTQGQETAGKPPRGVFDSGPQRL